MTKLRRTSSYRLAGPFVCVGVCVAIQIWTGWIELSRYCEYGEWLSVGFDRGYFVIAELTGDGLIELEIWTAWPRFVLWPKVHRGFALIPLWTVGAIVGIVLSLCRRARRIPVTGCRFCGYCLIGNVSGYCSECGALIREYDEGQAQLSNSVRTGK